MKELFALTLPSSNSGGETIPDPIGNTKPSGLTTSQGVISSDQNIGGIVSHLVPYIFAFAGLIMFVMFIMAGFTLLTAVGNKEKMAKGSSMLTSSILGFVIIFVAYWIMQLLELILGINLGFQATS